jgi:hypothetical protein
MYVCMYVCIDIFIYVCIYVYMYLCTNTFINMLVDVDIWICVYTYNGNQWLGKKSKILWCFWQTKIIDIIPFNLVDPKDTILSFFLFFSFSFYLCTPVSSCRALKPTEVFDDPAYATLLTIHCPYDPTIY